MECTNCTAPILTTMESQRYRFRKTGRIFCTKACGMAHRESRRTPAWTSKSRAVPRPEGVLCSGCGAAADLTGHRLYQWQRTQRAYCSRECSKAYVAQVSSETASRTNRQYASARMKIKNPMRDEATRKKVSDTLRAIGHGPVERGGNGKPATVAEVVLFTLLAPKGFVLRPVVRTGYPLGNHERVPPAYKPDLANYDWKIAIEADGVSHSGKRRALDQKKDRVLSGLGWTVLRFSNETVLATPASVLTTVESTISRLRASTPTSPGV